MFYFDLTSKPPYAATPEDFIFELFPLFQHAFKLLRISSESNLKLRSQPPVCLKSRSLR